MIDVKFFRKEANKDLTALKTVRMPAVPSVKDVVFIARDATGIVDNVIWNIDGDDPTVTVVLR